MRLTVKLTGLVALSVVPILLSGCNAGALLFLLLLDDGGGGGGGSRTGPAQPALIEFLGIESARSSPEVSVLRVRLTSEQAGPANLRIEFLDLTPAAAGAPPIVTGDGFAPITLREPLPGTVTAPGTLSGVPSNPEGAESRIGWNALDDLGDDRYHRVGLRFTAFVGDLEEVLEVEISVGNDAPVILEATSSQEPGEDVLLDVTLADSASDPVTLEITWSIDGETFAEATLADPLPPLATSPDGVAHQIAWRSVADVGAVDRPAFVRLVPTDVIPEEPGKTGEAVELSLDLDNNLPPVVELDQEGLIADPDERRGIALRFSVQDRERNPVDVIVQWARSGEGFPDLPAELDTDAGARESLLADPALRAELQIATLRPESLDGFVEAAAPDLPSPGPGLPATWLKHTHQLRGISPADNLVGKPMRVISPGGDSEERRICGYDAERGVLLVDSALDAEPAAGAKVSIDLSATLFMSSSADGILHRLIWDGAGDLPGGGAVSFRLTPFDRAASPGADGCGLIVQTDDPAVAPGARGTADESGEARSTAGPFRDDDAETIAVAPVDLPVALTTIDLDGDDSVDIVYSARGFDVIVAKLQTSPGRYDELRLLDALLSAPSGVVALDLDGNGLPDVAAPARDSNLVVVMRQHPDRDFFSDRSYLSVPAPEDLIATDFDGDDLPDLATVASGAGDAVEGPALAVFFTGQGDCGTRDGGYTPCTFPAPAGVSTLAALATADADGDGDADVFCAGESAIVTYLRGGADFEAPVVIQVPGADMVDVTGADVNGDGAVDIAAVDRAGGTLLAFIGAGDGTFSSTPLMLLEGLREPIEIESIHLDANAVSDFVIAEAGSADGVERGAVRVAIGAASGEYSSSRLERGGADASPPASPRALAVDDLDRDGTDDIISAEVIDPGTSAVEIAVYRQSPSGTFRAPPLTIPLDSAGGEISQPSLAAADLFGDAYVDLITVLRASNEVVIYDQVGPSSFETVRVPFPPSVSAGAPMAIAAGDIDGDGRGDIVTANFDSGNLTVLLQSEDGALDRAIAVSSSEALSGPQSVALGDIDGDGRLDMVAAGRDSSTVVLFLQGADGSFGGGTDLAASLDPGVDFESPISVATADLDGDGRLEIITANHRSENLTVFAPERSPAVLSLGASNRPVALDARDLSGDGRIDIVTANTTGVAASLALQNEDGSFVVSTLLDGEPGREATAVATGDLDGDGKPDIAVALAGDRPSVLRVLMQQGQPDFSDARTLDLGAGAMEAPVSVLAIDLDGDGELDLVSANRESGTITALYGGQ